jgi:hypothetical protein
VYKPKSAPPARTPKRRVVASESESDAESDAGASASDDGASDVSEQVTARSSKAGSKGKAKGKPKAKAPVAMRKVPPKLPEVEPAVADGLQELGKHLVAALPSREPLELYSQRTLTRHDKVPVLVECLSPTPPPLIAHRAQTRTAFTIAKVGADHVLLPLIATCSVGKDGDRRRARLAGQSSLMQVLRAKGLADRVSSQFLAVDGACPMRPLGVRLTRVWVRCRPAHGAVQRGGRHHAAVRPGQADRACIVPDHVHDRRVRRDGGGG